MERKSLAGSVARLQYIISLRCRLMLEKAAAFASSVQHHYTRFIGVHARMLFLVYFWCSYLIINDEVPLVTENMRTHWSIHAATLNSLQTIQPMVARLIRTGAVSPGVEIQPRYVLFGLPPESRNFNPVV